MTYFVFSYTFCAITLRYVSTVTVDAKSAFAKLGKELTGLSVADIAVATIPAALALVVLSNLVAGTVTSARRPAVRASAIYSAGLLFNTVTILAVTVSLLYLTFDYMDDVSFEASESLALLIERGQTVVLFCFAACAFLLIVCVLAVIPARLWTLHRGISSRQRLAAVAWRSVVVSAAPLLTVLLCVAAISRLDARRTVTLRLIGGATLIARELTTEPAARVTLLIENASDDVVVFARDSFSVHVPRADDMEPSVPACFGSFETGPCRGYFVRINVERWSASDDAFLLLRPTETGFLSGVMPLPNERIDMSITGPNKNPFAPQTAMRRPDAFVEDWKSEFILRWEYTIPGTPSRRITQVSPRLNNNSIYILRR